MTIESRYFAFTVHVLRVLHGKPEPVGVGFCVGADYIVTSAHVVKEAVGQGKDEPLMSLQVAVDSCLESRVTPHLTRVVFFDDRAEYDIAVLRWEANRPDDLRGAPLKSAGGLFGNSYAVYGVPFGSGTWSTGKFTYRTDKGWLQLEGTGATGQGIVEGFSGAPVWDLRLNGVVGMVSLVDPDPAKKVAYMIPVSVLAKASQFIRMGDFEEIIPPAAHVRFINRDDEQLAIADTLAPAIHLVDAPAGYGKTELLKQLRRRMDDRKWRTVYVSLNQARTIQTVVGEIADQLDLNLDGVELDYSENSLGRELAQLFLKTHTPSGEEDKIEGEGVVLFFDVDGRPFRALQGTIRRLVEDFIPGWHRRIRDQGSFSSQGTHNPNPSRIVVAGRYIYIRTTGFDWHGLYFQVVRLGTFNYRVVREAVETYFPDDADDHNQIAANVLFYSSGHPGCIARLFKLYESHFESGTNIDQFFSDRADEIWENIVWQESDDILMEVGRELRPVMEALSVYRSLDNSVLSYLLAGDSDLPQVYGEARGRWKTGKALGKALLRTYLMEHGRSFFADHVTRRLLLSRLLNSQTEGEFKKHCDTALDVCRFQLKNATGERRAQWAIEYLFQWLQGHIGQVNESTAFRSALQRRFFEEALPEILAAADSEDDAEEWLGWIQRSLITGDYDRRPDEEFQFKLNYYLRGEEFDSTPFQSFSQWLDDSIKAAGESTG